jgi:hypothetical protein
MKPRRFKLAFSSEERFLQQAVEMKRGAETMPPGGQREQLLELAHDADAARIDGWLTSRACSRRSEFVKIRNRSVRRGVVPNP